MPETIIDNNYEDENNINDNDCTLTTKNEKNFINNNDILLNDNPNDEPDIIIENVINFSCHSHYKRKNQISNSSDDTELEYDEEEEYDIEFQCNRKITRYSDGTVKLRNPNIELMDQDILYHIALGSGSHDLQEMFGDVKFVCMGGTPKRMENFAEYIMNEIGYKLPAGTQLQDISAYSYRYSMYKVGPVLAISHGMGTPSISILLHEIIKLMYHAKCHDPIFFRIGTCGGIGVEGGTVIITEEALDSQMQNHHEFIILGKSVMRPTKLDKKLARELQSLASEDDPYDTIIGKTLCTNDFYEGQGRLDGAFCEFSENDKMEYLNNLRGNGIVNIEMESTIFAALTHHAGIKAAIVCVAILNRLNGDQVNAPKEVMNEWQARPQILVSRYIRKYLGQRGQLGQVGMFGAQGSIKSPRRFKLVQQESQAIE